MTIGEVAVGVRVRSVIGFVGVPRGSEGVIDELYESGFMVAWDLPDRLLPPGYRAFDGRAAVASGILRDGFNRVQEIQYLERVG